VKDSPIYCHPVLLLLPFLSVGGLIATVAAQAPVVDRARADIAVLTADSLHGRGYQPDGASKAARYIRDRFQKIGVEPLNGSYFQRFQLTVDLVEQMPMLVTDGDTLAPGREFIPHGITGNGVVDNNDRVVSVGAGLVVPSQDINPYEAVDVRDAVIVIDEEVPQSIRSDTTLGRRDWSILPRVEYAASRGASAVVVLTDRLVYGMYSYESSVPVVSVLRSAWRDSIDTVSLHVELAADRQREARNVIGVVEGSEHSDSLIVISAHYDHIGRLGEDLYFPGANDNASGTAMLLALARYFSEHPLPYSIVCIAFSGEELGLVGSEYFAEYPPFDLSNIAFLLNFDMVASGTEGIMAVGGVDFPTPYRQLRAVNDSLGLDPLARRKNARNSDHYPLTQRGVPGFFLYTRSGDQPYHHIDDVMDTLSWDAWADVYTLARHFLESGRLWSTGER
jgi:hypothetical protein